jgi:hypothetical protein
VRALGELRDRRRARRWQHWTEVAPEDDFVRRAGIVTAIAVVFMLVVFAMIVIGLILALT